MSQYTTLNYRPDIDGLRAIAVLSVVAYHFSEMILAGGYVGVDVFFVISGFLITGNISRSLNDKNFSFLEFYRRRILRILPVLSIVVLTALIAGNLLFLPEDNITLAGSALASQLSAANVYFTYFVESDYFTDASEFQPLLHLWSLGVEEQFYLLWPVVLVFLLSKLSHLLKIVIVSVVAALSFFLAEHYILVNQSFSYYMLPARAGELLLGGIAYFIVEGKRGAISEKWGNALSFLGLVLILASIIFIKDEYGFPGLLAIPPTLGAALVILGGSCSNSGITKVISSKALVYVGLISYSLYLWHWPILAFYRYFYGAPTLLSGLVLLTLIFLTSHCSYIYIEKKFRGSAEHFYKVSLKWLVLPLIIVTGVFYLTIKTQGFGFYPLENYKEELEKAGKQEEPAFKYPYVCQAAVVTEKMLGNKACIINDSEEPKVLLWGDSHAAHYLGVVASMAETLGFGFRNVAHSSCPPTLSLGSIEKGTHPSRAASCVLSNEAVVPALKKYSVIFIGGSWDSYFNRNDDFLRDMNNTVEQLVAQGSKVVILGQIPRMPNLDRRCQLKSIKFPFVDCSSQIYFESNRPSSENKALKSLADQYADVYYVDVDGVICSGGRCSSYKGKSMIYFNGGHLSMNGSWIVGKEFVKDPGNLDMFLFLKGLKIGSGAGNVPLKEWLESGAQRKF